MEMTCRTNIIDINIAILHFKHRSRVGQDIALPQVRKDNRQSGRTAGSAHHAMGFHTTVRQALKRKPAQRITADFGYETNFCSEDGKIMSKNGGRAAEGKAEALGQIFPL